MKLLLAIPTGGSPTPPFLASLQELLMPDAVTAFDRVTIVGNFIPGQRELAVRRASVLGADVLVMIDDDMIVPPDALVRMIEALSSDARLAVVGALYYSRDGLRPMAADRWHSHDTASAAIPAFAGELTLCDVVGFGCVAIRMSALRTLVSPYFHCQVYVEEQAARVRICNEDYLFCEHVRHAGWSVALHAGVRCKHYDRASRIAQPAEWEDAAVTHVERMVVVEPGPAYRVVPYDTTVSTAVERHSVARVDYITVD